MKLHTTFFTRFALASILFFSQAFGFEYVLEKVYLKNPLLVKKEIAHSVEKENHELAGQIFELKCNIALNTIKFSLNILKNKEIADMYYNFNQAILSKLESEKDEKDESSNRLKEYLQNANLTLEIQNSNFETAISSYQRYTRNDYVQTNLLSIVELIEIPKDINQALAVFEKQDLDIQKAILNTFVIDEIKGQITSYYSEQKELQEELKETIVAKKGLFSELSKQDELLKFLEIQSQIKDLDKKLIELKYSLLFQKCKISFITGNLLEDIKTHAKAAYKKESEVLTQTPDLPLARLKRDAITLPKKVVAKPTKTSSSHYKLDKPNPFKHTTLKRIHFVGNMEDVSSYSIYIVARNAELLKEMKDYELELYGYTDNLGTNEENYNLGLQRAIKTKEALVYFGANPDKIKVFSRGDKDPIASNDTKKGRLLNRRVEFKLIKGK